MKTEYAKFHTDYKESFFFSHRDFVVRNEIHLGPDPDWTPPIECHYSILFYSDQTCSTFICFYFSTVLLFYSVLFSFALFSFTLYCALYSILFWLVMLCSILLYCFLPYSCLYCALFYYTISIFYSPFCPALFYSTLFHSVLWSSYCTLIVVYFCAIFYFFF